MSDFNSSLPVRTQTDGDVVVFLSDPITPSQKAIVDAFGSLSSVIKDAAGTAITSVTSGSHIALDVWDQSNGPVAPGTAAAYSSLIGGQYSASLPTLTNGQQSAIQIDSSGRLLVNTLNNDDHNFGTVGANTLRTAAQIGNATGAADFNFGTVGAQTVRVASQLGNATGAADFNAGATGAQTLRVAANQGAPNTLANAWPVKPTDGTNSQGYTAASEAKVSVTQPLPAGTNLIGSVNSRTLDSTGAAFSPTNPLPVHIVDSPGTAVNDPKATADIAAAATDNHDYTVTAGKTLHLNQIEASASGKLKIEVLIETAVASGTFVSRFVKFNSTSDPNISLVLENPIDVAAGVRVRVACTNKDNQAQPLYSTICGYEV